MFANVKNRFTLVSTRNVALAVELKGFPTPALPPGTAGPALTTVPSTAVGSAAANAGNQSLPLPPSAIETIAAPGV